MKGQLKLPYVNEENVGYKMEHAIWACDVQTLGGGGGGYPMKGLCKMRATFCSIISEVNYLSNSEKVVLFPRKTGITA